MTIWRDLKTLEQKGKLRRVHGGAVRTESSELEFEPRFAAKQERAKQEKAAIARYAVEHFIQDGNIVILEGGTTVASMVRLLANRRLTVLTNGLDILTLASDHLANVTLIGSGGILRENSRTFVGPQAVDFFKSFHAQTFFLSATGLTPSEGLTDPNPLEIQVKHAMSNASARSVLLIDSNKFGVRSLAQALPLERIEHIVTDAAAPPEALEPLRRMGITVHMV